MVVWAWNSTLGRTRCRPSGAVGVEDDVTVGQPFVIGGKEAGQDVLALAVRKGQGHFGAGAHDLHGPADQSAQAAGHGCVKARVLAQNGGQKRAPGTGQAGDEMELGIDGGWIYHVVSLCKRISGQT